MRFGGGVITDTEEGIIRQALISILDRHDNLVWISQDPADKGAIQSMGHGMCDKTLAWTAVPDA
jgi:hypothetical protein